MIVFREMGENEPTLQFSPIVRAAEKTFSYIAEHGGIELTPTKSLKRYFVHWAASTFAWPGYTAEELFQLNKVLNEVDFAPLMFLHDILLALKIGRHYKGKFDLTKSGKTLIGRPGKIFGILTPFLLFHVNHEYLSRRPTHLAGNWDLFLNVLNVEAENGVTAAAVGDAFERLIEPAADGLVVVDGHKLTVTDLGRPLVRIVAAAFDVYLARATARHSVAV